MACSVFPVPTELCLLSPYRSACAAAAGLHTAFNAGFMQECESFPKSRYVANRHGSFRGTRPPGWRPVPVHSR